MVWRRRRVEAKLGAVGMVTRGAAQYALFRLRKYSRMQDTDVMVGDGLESSAPRTETGTRHDARTACPSPSMSAPLRTPPQAAASPGPCWGHVSVQPLWCRVTQDGTPDGAHRMLVSVEWHATSRDDLCEAPSVTPPPSSPSRGTDRVVLVRVPPYPGIARFVGSFVVVDRPSFGPHCSDPIHRQGHLRGRPSGLPLSQGARGPRRSMSRTAHQSPHRFQLQFASAAEAQSFVQMIQVRRYSNLARMPLCPRARV